MSDTSFFQTTGFSMWPFIMPNEKLIIKKEEIKDLRAGDVILYISGSAAVCHRLVKKITKADGYSLYARGDNSTSQPELVSADAVLGRVSGVVRKGNVITLGGWQRRFMNRIIVFIAPLISIAVEMRNRIRRKI